jgi:lipopolysaccharide heptosyltransferase II
MKRVLVANIFGIGDVLFTTPLAAAVREKFPGVEIDYLVNARTRDIVSAVPGVGKVFVYEKDDIAKLWSSSKISAIREMWRLFLGIRRRRYDVVFDLTLSRQFGLIFMLAGIKKRAGLDYKKRGTFLTHKAELGGFAHKHVVEHYLDLLRSMGVEASSGKMTLVPPAGMKPWVDGYLKAKGLDAEKLVAVIPGGGASWSKHSYRKRWQSDSFAAVVRALSAAGWQTIVLGDASEAELCRDVVELSQEKNARAENGLDIKSYMALLSRARLALCNDGGPLHMAVALGVRTVSIFGPVDPAVYGPYPLSDSHRVIVSSSLSCRPCYKKFRLPKCDYDGRCLVDIPAEEVVEACEELLRSDE